MEKYSKKQKQKKQKKKKCPHCSALQEKVKLDKPTSFYKGKKEFFLREIRETPCEYSR